MENYKVVGEYIEHSCLYELKDHSTEMTDNDIIVNQDFENNYWAVVAVDDDGYYDYTVEDNFKSAEEAWAYYDKLTKKGIDK